MTDNQDSQGQGSIRHQLFAERLATIEANNDYQRQSLKQITQTLERVVETQAKLANQQEAINSIAADMKYVRQVIAEQETQIRIINMRQDKLIEDVDKNTDDLRSLQGRVIRNEAFTKQATWGITAIVTPIALYVAKQVAILLM